MALVLLTWPPLARKVVWPLLPLVSGAKAFAQCVHNGIGKPECITFSDQMSSHDRVQKPGATSTPLLLQSQLGNVLRHVGLKC